MGRIAMITIHPSAASIMPDIFGGNNVQPPYIFTGARTNCPTVCPRTEKNDSWCIDKYYGNGMFKELTFFGKYKNKMELEGQEERPYERVRAVSRRRPVPGSLPKEC